MGRFPALAPLAGEIRSRAGRTPRVAGPGRLPTAILAPSAAALAMLVLPLHAADAAPVAGSGGAYINPAHLPGIEPTAKGAVVIGREDLLRVRASLGRVSDELHLILGVLDQHLEASPVSLEGLSEAGEGRDGEFVPMPRATPPPAAEEEAPKPRSGFFTHRYVRALLAWGWTVGEWLFSTGIFTLDIGIVICMQLFLESIGRKRGGSSIMPKKGVASAIATKASGSPATAQPIPSPSATPGRANTQRLSFLLQEEMLAACLTEHWQKIAMGVGLAVACRLPQYVFRNDGLACHMLINLAVMLRCMSLVMLYLRDDMNVPKKERADKVPPVQMPPPEQHTTALSPRFAGSGSGNGSPRGPGSPAAGQGGPASG